MSLHWSGFKPESGRASSDAPQNAVDVVASAVPSAIATIVQKTGLAPHVWHLIRPFRTPAPTTHEVIHSGPDYEAILHDGIKIHDRTICALAALPAANVLGHGVLVHTGVDCRAMVSIAEAASVLLGKSLSDLLWILLEFIARELRADIANQKRQYTVIKRKEPPHSHGNSVMALRLLCRKPKVVGGKRSWPGTY
jgi:hypothetical protein